MKAEAGGLQVPDTVWATEQDPNYRQHWTVLVTWLIALTKTLAKKEGFVLAQSPRGQSIMEGKAWWQKQEAAGVHCWKGGRWMLGPSLLSAFSAVR